MRIFTFRYARFIHALLVIGPLTRKEQPQSDADRDFVPCLGERDECLNSRTQAVSLAALSGFDGIAA